MLDWLSSVGKKADHPMYNVEAARKLLEELPADPAKALEEITSWLDTVGTAEGFALDDRIGVIKLLDETGQALEPQVLSAYLHGEGLKEHDRLKLWQTLAEFWERVAAANRLCLTEIARAAEPGAAHPERTLLLVRALRAVSNEAKIRRFRYLPLAPNAWRALSELYSLSEKEGYAAESLKVYPSDPYPTTAQQEFLRELMLDASVPESQSPPEVELSARVTARLGGGFVVHPAPAAGCTFCFDLARPDRPIPCKPDTAATATMRYIGAGRVHAAIQEIIDLQAKDPEALEQRFGHDYGIQDKIGVLKRLQLHWGEAPPRRRTQRVKISAPMKVVHGFDASSHLVKRVEFSGMAEVTTNLSLKMKRQTGLGLEEQAATLTFSEWVERDASTWGLGVDIPRQDESWAKIATLCTFQPAGLKFWWVGVIRRFYRDAQGHAHAGIEVLAKKPLSVYLRGIGEGSQRADNWASSSGSFEFTYVSALLLGETTTDTRKEMLITRDTFAPGVLYEAMIGEATPHVRIEELLERGEDFERVRVTWLKATK